MSDFFTTPLAERFPDRVNAWQLRSRSIDFGLMPRVMGILNVTPDSFSDGGQFQHHTAAVHHGLKLVEDGADILDVGGESTRPYSEPTSLQAELDRVVGVIEALAARTDVPISVDTSKAQVAREAVAAGAEIINDVTALSGDEQMLAVALESGVGVCAMHMQGTPQTMQDNPTYGDVVADIFAFLARRRDILLAAGLPVKNLCLDPGVGFGKTHTHNLELLTNCWQFHGLGCPILVGHSRKGFIGQLLGDKKADRTAATVGASLSLAAQGIQIVRVHDVRETCDALRLFAASGGLGPSAPADWLPDPDS